MTVMSCALTNLSRSEGSETSNLNDLRRKISGMVCGIGTTSTITKESPVRFLLVIVLILASILIGSTDSHAQDVYNFYFQKNMGATPAVVTPQTTGTALPVSGANPPVMNTNTVQSDLKPVTEEKSSFRRFDIGIYKSWMGSPYTTKDPKWNDEYKGSYTREAYSLQGSYRFNKYVAAEAGVIYSTKWQSEWMNEDSKLGDGKDLDGNLGIALSPIHINFFGYELLEIGILGGFMTQTQYKNLADPNGYSSEDYKKATHKKAVVPYIGPRLGINLTPELALVVDARLKPQSDGGGFASVGLKYRF